MNLEDLVEGWTEEIVEQLQNNGVPLTGTDSFTDDQIELELFDLLGNQITLTGTTGWKDATQAKVYFRPAATDLLARYSPISMRWKLTDDANQVSFFPRKEADTWTVRARSDSSTTRRR